MNKIKRPSGNALITALFVMSLVAIAAIAMSLRIRLDIKRTQMSQEQLNRISLLESEATRIFVRYQTTILKNDPQILENLSLPLESHFERKGYGTLTTILNDEEGKLNVNALLGDPETRKSFERLLKYVDPMITSSKVTGIIQWIVQRASEMHGDKFINILEVAPAFQNDFETFAPYLSALPDTKQTLHVLSARAETIGAFYKDVNPQQISSLLSDSAQMPLRQKIQLFQQLGIKIDPGQQKAKYLSVSIFMDNSAQNEAFRFTRNAQFNNNTINIMSENWF